MARVNIKTDERPRGGASDIATASDALSQARALLQRARVVVKLFDPLCDADTLVPEIDAFLAAPIAAETPPDGDDAPDPLPDLLLDFSVAVSRWLREHDLTHEQHAVALHEKIAHALPESDPRRRSADRLRRALDRCRPRRAAYTPEEQTRAALRQGGRVAEDADPHDDEDEECDEPLWRCACGYEGWSRDCHHVEGDLQKPWCDICGSDSAWTLNPRAVPSGKGGS